MQWDPERKLNGQKTGNRIKAIQIGLIARGVIQDYALNQIISISDITSRICPNRDR